MYVLPQAPFVLTSGTDHIFFFFACFVNFLLTVRHFG